MQVSHWPLSASTVVYAEDDGGRGGDCEEQSPALVGAVSDQSHSVQGSPSCEIVEHAPQPLHERCPLHRGERGRRGSSRTACLKLLNSVVGENTLEMKEMPGIEWYLTINVRCSVLTLDLTFVTR